jgi:hypothetical protein
MGGSSGGGGSAGSGKIEYHADIMSPWKELVNNDDGTGLTQNAWAAANTMTTNNPYSGESAYDVSESLDLAEDHIDTFAGFVTSFDPSTIWTSTVAVKDWLENYTEILAAVGAISIATEVETAIDDASSANADLIDDEVENTHLPRFQVGMRDINAVMTSAFAIGQSNIEAAAVKAKAVADKDLRLQGLLKKIDTELQTTALRYKIVMEGASVETQALNQRVAAYLELAKTELEYDRIVAATYLEYYRIKVVSESEEVDSNMNIEALEYSWDMDAMLKAANVFASIHGAASTVSKTPTRGQSAIGGALSGAAAGAMVGSAIPGVGTAIGAGVGALLGLGGSFL